MPDEKWVERELEQIAEELWREEKEFFLAHLDDAYNDFLLHELHTTGKVEVEDEGLDFWDFLPDDVVWEGNGVFYSGKAHTQYVVKTKHFTIETRRPF